MPATRFVTTAMAAALAIAIPATARSAETEDGGRYTMSPAEGGFVRLDKSTGAMAVCSRKDGAWACEPMGDATAAMRGEIDRLERENQALKSDKKHLEEMLGMGEPGKPDAAKPDGPGAGGSFQIPDEKDVDKLFDYFEGMVRKLRERIRKLEEESEKGQPL